MYIYNDSNYLIRSIGAQWKKDSETELHLENISMYDIFTNYVKVYLILSHTDIEGTFFVDLDQLRLEFSNSGMTLNELLVFLDNRTLEYVDSIPSTSIKYARYGDAVRAKYKINTTIIGSQLPDNYPQKDKKDLVIERPVINGHLTDVTLLHTHCLISVNGYYHITDTDGIKTYVPEGGSTLHKSNNNQLGILSFLDVGAIKKVPIDINSIFGQTEESPLSEKVMFSVDEDLDNKSYILVLGGYLIFPIDTVFWRNGVSSFALDLNKIPYVERLYESSLYIKLDDLELTEQITGDNVYSYPELWSDDVIKKYMTLSQSYLVVVDIPYLFTEKMFIKKTNLPGMFISYQDPIQPLVVSYGKVAEYWKTYEDGQWSVTVNDSFLRNYIISTQTDDHLIGVNNNMLPTRPFDHSRGYLLNIYGHQG